MKMTNLEAYLMIPVTRLLMIPNPFENYILSKMYEHPDVWHELPTIYQGLEEYANLFKDRIEGMAEKGLLIIGYRGGEKKIFSKTGLEIWEEKLNAYESGVGRKVTNAEALELLKEDIMKREPETGIYKHFWETLIPLLKGEA